MFRSILKPRAISRAVILADIMTEGVPQIIDGALDVSLWERALSADVLQTNLWLLAYEADLKGWLQAPVAGYVMTHPYFAELRRRKVSFYDDEKTLRNVRRLKPKGPSEAFLKHMAALRAKPIEFDDVLDELEEWEQDEGEYGGY